MMIQNFVKAGKTKSSPAFLVLWIRLYFDSPDRLYFHLLFSEILFSSDGSRRSDDYTR